MTAGIGEFESLLANWREAEAKAEVLRQFRDSGGEHRLRINTDLPDQIPARVLEEMMDGGGFRWLLNTAVKHAEERAEKAEKTFRVTAATVVPLP